MPIPMLGINPMTLGRFVKIGYDIGGPSIYIDTDNKTNDKKTAKPNDKKTESKTQTQTEPKKQETETIRNDTQDKNDSGFSLYA